MLVRFRVKNHRSLRDEQSLSMVAAEPLDDPRLISTPAFAEKLLPSLAIYGANASGKSTVLDALCFMCDAVQDSQRRWEPTAPIPYKPFALSALGDAPSLYEVDIVVPSVRVTYGFEMTGERILREWLRAFPQAGERPVFEREADAFTFHPELTGPNDVIQSLTRPNSLFLSAAAQNNHRELKAVFAWFQAFGRGMRPEVRVDVERVVVESYRQATPKVREEMLGEIGALLRFADTGIEAVRVAEVESASPRVELRHSTDDPSRAWLSLKEESNGTRRLFFMASFLLFARTGGVSCIDELEASLHPAVALELLRSHNAAPNRGQILFTTHDALLLQPLDGEPPLRRDQIWLTEKDRDGATHLYPLSDFAPREPENLARGYLQGRYGAVPFVGDLPALLGNKV